MLISKKINIKKNLNKFSLGFIFGILVCYSSLLYTEESLQWKQSKNTFSEINTCFTPEQNCEVLITNILDQAKESILVQAYAFTSKPIAQALIRCKNRGVKVRVLYEEKQNSQNSQIKKLKQSGMEVRADKTKGVAHNKVMIIDEKYVITGSFNFTYAAQHLNAENVILINNPEFTKFYIDNWKSRYAKSKSIGY